MESIPQDGNYRLRLLLHRKEELVNLQAFRAGVTVT
jgi:hypothetical protein